jgi:hypothetical protein
MNGVRDKEIEFFNSLESIDKKTYENVDLDRLVLYAVEKLEESNIEPTFDKVVVTTFKLFPEKFSLIGFPKFPDAKRVHDCLWHCTYKTKRWLFGTAKSGYKITEKGKYFLEETKKILQGEIKISKKYELKPQRKEVFFINLIKKTNAFKKYLGGKTGEITETEIREILRADTNSPKEALRQNLEKYSDYAEKINSPLVKEFLNFIKERWGSLFE